MPNSNLLAGSGGGGGGGGLHFRDPADVFADDTARSTYFTTTDTTAFGEFVRDRTLAIVIGTIANPTAIQTYLGDAGTYDDTMWVSRLDAVQGPAGRAGSDGTPGGGAWNSLGSHSESDPHASNDFFGTGITIPDGRPVIGYRLAGNQNSLEQNAGIMMISANLLFSKAAADDGDTSTDDNSVHLPEFSSGGVVTGTVHAGYTSSRELLIATTTANQTTSIEVFEYVPATAQGGRTDAEIQALIDATPLSNLQGEVADSQIPASIFRDAEFTAAAVRTQLGLTQAEAEALLTGNPTISGDTITFTRNDGTMVTVSLADFLSETEFSAQRGSRLYLGSPTTYDTTTHVLAVTLTPSLATAIGDQALFIAPGNLDDSGDAITVQATATPDYPLQNDDGDAIGASHLVGGRVYSMLRLNGAWRILEPLEERPQTTIAIATGWSTDQTAEVAEFTATAMAHEVTIPSHTNNDYLLLWTADSEGTLSEVHFDGASLNELNTFTAGTALELNGEAGTARVTVNRRIASLLSGSVISVVFS